MSEYHTDLKVLSETGARFSPRRDRSTDTAYRVAGLGHRNITLPRSASWADDSHSTHSPSSSKKWCGRATSPKLMLPTDTRPCLYKESQREVTSRSNVASSAFDVGPLRYLDAMLAS